MSIGHVSVEVEIKPDKKKIPVIGQAIRDSVLQGNRALQKEAQKQHKKNLALKSKKFRDDLKQNKKAYKQLQRYELQYARETKNKKMAMDKAEARMKLRLLNSQAADEADHQEKMAKALEKKKSLAQQVASGAFWGSALGTSMGGAVKSVSGYLGQASQTLERRDLQKFYREKYQEKAYKDTVSMMLQTGHSVEDLAKSVKSLDDVLGTGGLSLSKKVAGLSSPLYDFSSQISDVENVLRGGQTDTMGAFAKKYGQGNVRMLNATLQRQQMLVDAGVYQDMGEASLIREREARINNVLSKGKRDYTVSDEIRKSRALESAKNEAEIEVAEQSVSKFWQGVEQTGLKMDPEALAQNKIAGKAVTATESFLSGDLATGVANSLSLLGDTAAQLKETFAGIFKIFEKKEVVQPDVVR